MATITERTVSGTGFANTIELRLDSDGSAITGTALTRAKLTLTDTSGAETVLDSATVGWGADQPFEWDSSTAVLTLRLAEQVTAGVYTAELDVYDGADWWRWTLNDTLRIVAE